MNLLSNQQKSTIAQLARAAWEARADLREPLLEANLETMSKTEIYNAWRHVEQGNAVGRQSLTKCTSEEHFMPLCAHFQRLAGNRAGAARALARHETNPKRIAHYKLEQACRQAGVDLGYAAAICRTQNKCPLDQASEKQLWRLVFTIRNRRKVSREVAKVAKVAKVAEGDDPF